MDIFISHSSYDVIYAQPLTDFLIDIGISSNSIVCTSLSTHKIPAGNGIYEWLEQQLNSTKFIIYILSNNFFISPSCLFEAGVSKKSKHVLLATHDFNFDNSNFLNCAFNPHEKIVNLYDEESMYYLVDKLIVDLKLPLNTFKINSAIKKYLSQLSNVFINVNKFLQESICENLNNSFKLRNGMIYKVNSLNITKSSDNNKYLIVNLTTELDKNFRSNSVTLYSNEYALINCDGQILSMDEHIGVEKKYVFPYTIKKKTIVNGNIAFKLPPHIVRSFLTFPDMFDNQHVGSVHYIQMDFT